MCEPETGNKPSPHPRSSTCRDQQPERTRYPIQRCGLNAYPLRANTMKATMCPQETQATGSHKLPMRRKGNPIGCTSRTREDERQAGPDQATATSKIAPAGKRMLQCRDSQEGEWSTEKQAVRLQRPLELSDQTRPEKSGKEISAVPSGAFPRTHDSHNESVRDYESSYGRPRLPLAADQHR